MQKLTEKHVSFEAQIPEEELDLYLKTNSYPDDVIADMTYLHKLNSYQTKCKFIAKLDSDSEEAQDYALQELNNFYGRFNVESQWSGNPNLNLLKITFSWDWDYAPFMTLTDKVSMGWATDAPGHFLYVEDTAYHEHKAHLVNPATGQKYNYSFLSFDIEDPIPEAGVGCKYDIYSHNNYGDIVYKNEGHLYATVQKITPPGYSGHQYILGLSGRYFHQKISINGVLSWLPLGDKKMDLSISGFGTVYDVSKLYYKTQILTFR